MSGVKKVFKKVKDKFHKEKKPSDIPTEVFEAEQLANDSPAVNGQDPSATPSADDEAKPRSANISAGKSVPAPTPVTSPLVEPGVLTNGDPNGLALPNTNVSKTVAQQASALTGKSPQTETDPQVSSPNVGTTQTVPTSTTEHTEPWIILELKHFWYAFLAVLLVILLLGVSWERPSIWEFLLATLLFIPVGFMHAYLSKKNEIKKTESNNLLRVNPGIKGLNYLLGSVPTWVSFKEKEKAEVLNAIVREMWPYLDKAVASTVKAAVEPTLVQCKPSFISRIYFKDFTFGGAPIEFDNIWVDKHTKDKLVMEVDIRWSADTSNIALAVDTIGSSDFTRLVVRVTDIALSGTCRMTFQPLIDEYPGFGAMTVALIGIPILRYTPNFGKLGGSFTAKAVQGWLDGVIRQNLVGQLVWPERLVIPIFDEKITGPLDNLYLRHQGALKVEFVEGKDFKSYDLFSKSDPFVEAWTNTQFVEATKVVHNSHDPKWNETKWFLIQEPDTQCLYINLFDHDNFTPKDLLKIGMMKDPLGGSKTLMGRCKVHLKDITANPCVMTERTVDLGREEFSNLEGCGTGEGTITIRITYFPLDMVDANKATMGALQIRLVEAKNVPMEGEDDEPDPYVVFKLQGGNAKEQRSKVVMNSTNPKWTDDKFEFIMVHRNDEMEVVLMDSDAHSKDEEIGSFSRKVSQFNPGLSEYPIKLHKSLLSSKKKRRAIDAKEEPVVMLRTVWIPFE